MFYLQVLFHITAACTLTAASLQLHASAFGAQMKT
jgi:hypothetical protein